MKRIKKCSERRNGFTKTLMCVHYTCKDCANAVCVKNANWDFDKKYICSSNPRKHKEIKARDCNAFKCKNPCLYAKNCRGVE